MEILTNANLSTHYDDDQIDYLRSFESYLLFPQFPVIAAVLSRFAEAGVRIGFFVFTSIVTILFEELGKQIEDLYENDSSDNNAKEMVWILEKSTDNCDLIARLIQKINRCFGLILLLISGGDFLFSIFAFCEILEKLNFSESGVMDYYHFYLLSFFAYSSIPQSLKMATFYFVYTTTRYLLILFSSNRVASSVIISFLI